MIHKPRVLQDSRKEINSYINPIEAFKREGNYTIKPQHSNKACYEVLRNKFYSKEGNENNLILSKKVNNKEEFNQLKQSLPVIPNKAVAPNDDLSKSTNNLQINSQIGANGAISNSRINKEYKLNDFYFYKNMTGNQMKYEHYYYSNRQP